MIIIIYTILINYFFDVVELFGIINEVFFDWGVEGVKVGYTKGMFLEDLLEATVGVDDCVLLSWILLKLRL